MGQYSEVAWRGRRWQWKGGDDWGCPFATDDALLTGFTGARHYDGPLEYHGALGVSPRGAPFRVGVVATAYGRVVGVTETPWWDETWHIDVDDPRLAEWRADVEAAAIRWRPTEEAR